MNANLLSNKELENYSLDDSFNFKIKADAIKYFLEFNSIALEKNKMLVLYGDWGSGKTSLMKHIASEINKQIYYPIFFHAWEHEKDENLALSLCDLLIESANDNSDVIRDFMKGALITLKSFASGITLKTPTFVPGIELEFSGEKVTTTIDKAFKDSAPTSFYQSNEEFKQSFKKVEDLILKKSLAQKIMIFVDDLDRCEPENVLNLITAIKLFFGYGDKCVFFCGVDKNAVAKAVETKYKDVVKSEEYMEKVFDIAFNMPRTYSLKKMLLIYFDEFKLTLNDQRDFFAVDLIEEFFQSIGFTNPRHLKKVLNKYEIIKAFASSESIPDNIKFLMPNIIENKNEGSIFETIYCLYVIVLYEFYFEQFEDVENYSQKMIKYTGILHETRLKSDVNYNKGQAANDVRAYIKISEPNLSTVKAILASSQGLGQNPRGFSKFLFIFSHSHPSSLFYMYDHELQNYVQYFEDNSISTNFCKFLIKYGPLISEETQNSDYVIKNIFDMVKYLV